MRGMYTTYKDALADLETEFPKAKVVDRNNSKLMRVIAVLLFWNPRFLSSYATTIGYTIYMPEHWNDHTKAETVTHERIHMRQFRRLGILMFLGYLFWLPAVWTLRSEWEYEAYVASLKFEALVHGSVPQYTIEWLLDVFSGPRYLFMNPFRKKLRAKLEAKKINIDAMVRDGRLSANCAMGL